PTTPSASASSSATRRWTPSPPPTRVSSMSSAPDRSSSWMPPPRRCWICWRTAPPTMVIWSARSAIAACPPPMRTSWSANCASPGLSSATRRPMPPPPRPIIRPPIFRCRHWSSTSPT
ncbi:hypothetical protein LTR94_034131, partial [Friedmanniomyces endolithicus]